MSYGHVEISGRVVAFGLMFLVFTAACVAFIWWVSGVLG